MKSWKKVTPFVILTLVTQGGYLAEAKPKPQVDGTATYSVIHAIPAGFGADVVDVYANNSLIIDNATPGAVKSFKVAKGNVKVKIYANGVTPSDTATPLLSTDDIYLGSGTDFSFVAHLTAEEKAKLSFFKNMVTDAGKKRSWLTFRHVAAAPAVQFRVNGDRTFIPISNSMERKKSYITKMYSVSATLIDSTTVLVGPVPLTLQGDTNTVLYLWGAKSKGNLTFLKQEGPTKR